MGLDTLYDLGEAGVVNETGTTAIVAPAGKYFAAIQVIEDAIFTLLNDESATGDALTGRTILAGQILFGRFSAFTLSSGAVRAYLRKDKNA